jgi:hypothetical protein
MSAATCTNAGSSAMVSRMPVSQADTRGLAWPSRSCSARNAFTLRRMRSK